MSRRCSVCSAENASDIDAKLIEGVSQSALARDFQVSRHALIRHSKHFLQRRREREAVDRRAVPGRPPTDPVATLFSKIKKYERQVEAVLRRSTRKGKDANALKSLRELARLCELEARGSAALQPPAPAVSSAAGQMLAEASKRLAEHRRQEWAKREAEWERRRGMGALELLREAARLVELEDDAAIGSVEAALRALQPARAPSVEVVNEPVIEAAVVTDAPTDSAPLAPVVSIDRPRHTCSSSCTTFNCSRKMEAEQDDPGPTDWRNAPW